MSEKAKSDPARVQSTEARPAIGSALPSSSLLESSGSGTEQALRSALEYLHFAVNEYLSYSPSRRDSKMGSSLDGAMRAADEAIRLASSPASVAKPLTPDILATALQDRIHPTSGRLLSSSPVLASVATGAAAEGSER